MMGRPAGSKNKRKPARKRALKQPEVEVEVEASPARSRKSEIRGERRRRNPELDGHRMRLAIPPEFKEDADNEYRWINDDRSRVYDLTKQDDWDQVKSEDIVGHDGANTVRRQVGTKVNGEPLFAHLVRKPKEWCDEDRAKKEAALAETMEQLAQGKRGDPASLGQGQAGYVAVDTQIRDGRLK